VVGGLVSAQGIHEEHAGRALLIYCLLKICIGNANEVFVRKIMAFDKWFDAGQSYIRLIIIIFSVALLAKGAAIFRGFAVDDYIFIHGVKPEELIVFFSQGRYIMAATVWAVDSLGANINDMYFPLGIATLFLQASLVVSILRFVGMEDSPSAGLVGALMVAHPYLAETLTFRMVLPGYCVALIFSILTLEMVSRSPATWHTRVFALLSTFAMLLTYQAFLNYFAVAIVFAFFFGQGVKNRNNQSVAANNVYRERAISLAIICVISALAFVLITGLTKALGLIEVTGRANFIGLSDIPERIDQISSSLVNIYWAAEPVFPGWLKILFLLMIAMSLAIVFGYSFAQSKCNDKSVGRLFSALFAVSILIPVSLGVILVFKDWWPVPRVIAHISIAIGLIFLLADSYIRDLDGRYLKSIILFSRLITLVGFLIINNQILADQQTINEWDRMKANRIVSRLEMSPNFGNVKYVHIEGGTWGYPAKLRTIQGDMNMSAFFPDYSKVSLLTGVSGYMFEKATGAKAIIGKTYCESKQPWPHAESIAIDNDIAIICLKK